VYPAVSCALRRRLRAPSRKVSSNPMPPARFSACCRRRPQRTRRPPPLPGAPPGRQARTTLCPARRTCPSRYPPVAATTRARPHRRGR